MDRGTDCPMSWLWFLRKSIKKDPPIASSLQEVVTVKQQEKLSENDKKEKGDKGSFSLV